MSLPYRLGSNSMFTRPNENTIDPKRVIFLSVEGTNTEIAYFNHVERNRKALGIDAIVHIEVLRKYDTKSDPDNVLELLEEYVQFRESNLYEEEIEALRLKSYTTEFIRSYLDNPSSLSKKDRHRFEAVLRDEHIDLLYLNFLSKYHGEDDKFGIVIDRDQRSHTVEQMARVIKKCDSKSYLWYITNPCFEFWLLLHVSDIKTEYSDSLEDILDNKVDEKGNSYVSNLLHAKTGQRKTIQAKIFEQFYLPNINSAIERAKAFASKNELIDNIGSNLGDLFPLLRTV